MPIPLLALAVLAAAPPALEPCRLGKLEETARCGTFEVFEDRAAGRGRRISLRVGILPATGPDRAPDPLFVLQGGPGQAATSLAEFYGTSFPEIRRRRDIVLVDQRGTGGSNGLECDLHGDGSDPQPLLGPSFPLAAVEACRDRLAARADLRLYSTPIAMDDLDDVRAWLGYDRINLYGTSYGTVAAQEYIRRHGPRVRTAILRAAVAPSRNWGVHYARNAHRAMDRLFGLCAADAGCAAAYPRLRGDFEAVLEALGREEVRVGPGADGKAVRLPRGAAAAALRAALTAPATAAQIPSVVTRAARGDFGPLAAAALQLRRAQARELSEGMFLSVMCSELVDGMDEAAAARESGGTFVGAEPMRELAQACARWPRPAAPPAGARPLRAETPVLVISGWLDPSTPPDNGDELLEGLPAGRHLVIRHAGHSFNNLAGCVDGIMAEFVAEGSARGLQTGCAERIPMPAFVLPEAGGR